MHGYGPSELQNRLSAKKKANAFVARWSLGIFVAQDEKRCKERIMYSRGMDLTDL